MKLYGKIDEIKKQDDGTIIVSGYASTESTDSDGEIIQATAMKAAIPDYMKFANVREMHDSKKAAGTVLEMEVQKNGKTYVQTHIVDAEACKKVNAKVYKGFSIGGRVTERDEGDRKIIKGIILSEISLVDRPANPGAVFTVFKVDGGNGADTETPAAKESDTAAAGEQENAGDANASAAATDTSTAVTSPATAAAGVSTETAAGAGDTAAALATEAAPEAGKEAAAKPDDLKKGMWGVSYLASILSNIQDLQNSAEWEAANEGDGSAMPAELLAWLKQGGELLGAMVTEEVAEMTATNEVVVDLVSMADKVKTLVKAAFGDADGDKFAKGLDHLVAHCNDRIAKAGKRNSAADQKHLDAIHAAATALGASCGTDKAAGSGDDLQKMAKLEGDLKLANEVAEVLGKRVKELEAMPAAPKATLRVVEKGADAPAPEAADENKVEKSDTPTEAMKKVWRGGAKIV